MITDRSNFKRLSLPLAGRLDFFVSNKSDCYECNRQKL